ncbi:MAG: bifunctional aldolase/short-chain dehydrogenase [Deltaproteobacteria bacterium]|nr:bifunctional aldolase/short-chain dehydrogenase [Deltaproteobacteria bacterium]
MKNSFNKSRAGEFVQEHSAVPEELALRVYTSRLIGAETNLVLHGGGNTSVKMKVKNILGEEREVLFVKGSGQDLAAITEQGFVGLDLEFVRKLRNLESLTDEDMNNALRTHKLDADSPDPSVEALLHAFFPHKYVDHTHADSILAITNTRNGSDLIEDALGPRVAVMPYAMSGLPLAKGAVDLYENDPSIEAIVVLNHGIFTFGDDAQTSYSRMIDYVARAETYIERKLRGVAKKKSKSGVCAPRDMARLVQTVRGACAHRDLDGRYRRFYVETINKPDLVEVSCSDDAGDICRSGVIVPDHVIWTKNRFIHIDAIPAGDEDLKKVVEDAVTAFKRDYDQYVSSQLKAKEIGRERLDPYPRVFLVAGLGVVALGYSRREARIAADLAAHNIRVKRLSGAVGEYVPIADSHAFDMEYWSLQQKKKRAAGGSSLQGQVAFVTGAAGAIGFGIADRLIDAGAVVALADIDEDGLEKVQSILAEKYSESSVESVCFDVTDFDSVRDAVSKVSVRLGGIDILVPNAGIAHVDTIEDLSPKKFDRVVAVNLMGTFNVIKASIPVFRRQGTGGSVVTISSKNVFSPGAAFGAYSASKAAAHQISRIAALELGQLGVRVNMVNPDAVFGDEDVSSKLWDLIGPDRMKARGLDPEGLREYYRERNLLKVSVKPEHVGDAVVFFARDDTPITGATLPLDGGVPGAFPR